MSQAHADLLAARETILEALADALAGSPSDEAALALVEGAAGEARPLARAATEALRKGTPLLVAIADALALDARDRALLAEVAREGNSPASPSSISAALRAVADRIRARTERRRAIASALVTPIGLMALGIAIEPLPNLVLGGGYLAPVARGLAVLGAVVAAIFFGVPRLLRAPSIRAPLFDLLAALPFVGAPTRAAMEAEVALVLAPFADGTTIDPAGLRALSVVAADGGGPLSRALRGARGGERTSLERVGAHASSPLRLLLATAPAARRLDERLARFGRDATDASTRTLRRAVAIVAWTVMLATSVPMLARTLGGGLGGAKIPGLELPTNAEQEELDKIMKEGR